MKILFISHEASLTGAPLYLLNFCRHLKDKTGWQFYFLFKSDGPLSKEFSEIGTTLYFNTQTSPKLSKKISNRLQGFYLFKKARQRLLKEKIRSLGIDLIYSNTATNGSILDYLADLKIKTITHVHELEGAIDYYGEQNLQSIIKHSFAYVSSSISVTKYIKKRIVAEKDRILELNCTPIHTLPKEVNKTTLKASLGIPDNAFVVGASGTVQWRKGWDLFIRLAQNMNNIAPANNFYFVWVGKFLDKSLTKDIDNELNLTGLKDKVLFIGEKTNPMQYYSIFDTFCLMSREEAFGIVAIECALYSIPINCFEEAEGLSNFAKNDAGFVIPHLNTYEMAKALVALYDDIHMRKRMGQVAYDRVSKDYNIADQIDKFCLFSKNIVGK